jgi:hypothetical protein
VFTQFELTDSTYFLVDGVEYENDNDNDNDNDGVANKNAKTTNILKLKTKQGIQPCKGSFKEKVETDEFRKKRKKRKKRKSQNSPKKAGFRPGLQPTIHPPTHPPTHPFFNSMKLFNVLH